MVNPPPIAVASGSNPGSRPEFQPKRTRYEGSSQHRRWTYTADKLESNRVMLSEKAIGSCRKNHARELELQLAADPDYAPKSALPPYPTHTDELLLTRFYLTQLSTVLSTGDFGRPIPLLLIEDVALTYLKRFYLRTSCLEYHPKVIMPVCIFLAAKAKNYVLDVDRFVAVFDKLKKEDVLELEYLVVQTLRYDLSVPQPKDELHGWYLRLQDPSSPQTQTHLLSLLPHATQNLRKSRLSDVEHLYTPSQIAATCWRMSDRGWFDKRLRVVVGSEDALNGDAEEVDGDRDGMDVDVDVAADVETKGTISPKPNPKSKFPLPSLLARLTEIETIILNTADSFDLKKVKIVDKAVRACQDPIKVKSSAIYRKKQQLLESKGAEKRASKIARARSLASSKDLFGPVIVNNGGGSSGGGEVLPIQKGEVGFIDIQQSGMGVQADSGGMMLAGEGLRDVGLVLSDSESD